MDRRGHRQITTIQQYLGSLHDAGERVLKAFEGSKSPPLARQFRYLQDVGGFR